jgi:hypothetical protein
MNPDDLQRLIDRELKRLPAPRAPQTLLPRVLAATVGRNPAPFYTRPWFAWPLAWRVASMAAIVALAAAFFLLKGPAQEAAVRVSSQIAGQSHSGVDTSSLESAATVVRLAWRLLLAPAAFISLVFVVSLSLAFAAIWAALDRLALGGASQQ